jgi:hypothetical protein
MELIKHNGVPLNTLPGFKRAHDYKNAKEAEESTTNKRSILS